MDLARLNIFERAQRWKSHVQTTLITLRADGAALQAAFEQLRAEVSFNGDRDLLLNSLQALAEKHNAAAATAEARLLDVERELRRLELERGVREQLEAALSSAVAAQAAASAALDQERLAREELKSMIEADRAARAADRASLAEIKALVEGLVGEVQTLRHQAIETAALNQKHDQLVGEVATVFRAMAQIAGPAGKLLASSVGAYMTERQGTVTIVASLSPRAELVLASTDTAALIAKIADGSISRLFITADPPPDGKPSLEAADELVRLFREMPMLAHQFFAKAAPADKELDEHLFYRHALTRLQTNPYVLDSVVEAYRQLFGANPPPFDERTKAPYTAPAEPKRRAAVFLHNNYYHYNCLSKALRKRGWDAITVSIESPVSPQRQFYHGEDVNLFDPDFNVMREKIRAFMTSVPERFGALHFYGEGQASFFPEHYETDPRPKKVPWDFFELRRHRTIIGYMPTGCLDGARQSDIRRITGGLCSKCVWEHHPGVCNDGRSAAWAQRLDAVCDWVSLEGDWVVGARTGGKYVRGPVVTALDPDAWSPSLEAPKEFIVPREEGEILVYHGVGNYDLRRNADRDIKGTGAVLEAIESLKREGLPVRLMFLSKVASRDMRYHQVQADIVIDQLNYGRYGANARECMMLGLPVISAINPAQEGTSEPLRNLAESPIVRASTENVRDVLRELVIDPSARELTGRASRAFALRWHAADACAERYERVIDRIRAGMPPDAPDLYPGRANLETALALVSGGT